jgi:3-hydroxybutyryl-CoA dehydratase
VSTTGPPAVVSLTRLVDQRRVDRYAEAARDANPIHRDTPEAHAGQFGRPIAHGMLVLALVSDAMAQAAGARWASTGTLKVRWRAPALPPVTVTARCTLKSAADGLATYGVACETEAGDILLTGTATVQIE